MSQDVDKKEFYVDHSTARRGWSPKPTERQNYRVENGSSAEYGDIILVGVQVAEAKRFGELTGFRQYRGQAEDRILARLFNPYRLPFQLSELRSQIVLFRARVSSVYDSAMGASPFRRSTS